MIEPDLPEDRTHAREQLSSLMDGDAAPDSVAHACRQWRQDADTRAQWHAYHLIGDALRSEDLSQRSAGDADFLRSVRERLAREPIVLAPSPAQVPATAAVDNVVERVAQAQAGSNRRSRFHLRRWVAPVGMAAGVALVAGAVLVTRPGGGQGELTMASVTRVEPARTPADPTAPVTDTELVRYLDAHQHFPGTPALGPAPGFLRSAAYEPIPSR
jgi:sigma-E factor negative regulatory protein RseA